MRERDIARDLPVTEPTRCIEMDIEMCDGAIQGRFRVPPTRDRPPSVDGEGVVERYDGLRTYVAESLA